MTGLMKLFFEALYEEEHDPDPPAPQPPVRNLSIVSPQISGLIQVIGTLPPKSRTFLDVLSFFEVLGPQNHSKPPKPPFSIQVKPVNADFPRFRPKSGLSQLFPKYSWKNKNGKQGGINFKTSDFLKSGGLKFALPHQPGAQDLDISTSQNIRRFRGTGVEL